MLSQYNNESDQDNEYNELIKGLEEIKKEINILNDKKKFKKFGILDSEYFKKYLLFLKEQKNGESNNQFINFKKLYRKIEDKDYSYISKNFVFTFPINFAFITEKSISLILKKIDDKNIKRKIESESYNIIIGGKCIIMTDPREKSSYSYLVLFDEINENNNIDYILYI